MARFHLTVCSLILIGRVGLSMPRQLGFLHRYENVKRRLDAVIAKHDTTHLQDAIYLDWIEQKLDHFAPACTETWRHGESPVTIGWLQYSFMARLAEEYKAATFVVEHRFYGRSNPKKNLTTDSLKYLSSEQALADLAYFITRMNIEHKFTNPKWIVFGGSYAGSLAAWLRYRYPHLVYAAVASSGPLYAKVDFPEYYKSVSKILSKESLKCVEAIRTANQKMSEGMHKKEKREHYQDLFKLGPYLRRKWKYVLVSALS